MTTAAFPPRSFGALLKRHRHAAELTLQALATHAHLNVTVIAAFESGRRRWPHEDMVMQPADALQLSEAERIVFHAAAR